MSQRSQTFAVVLVAVFIVGTCSVLFAHAGTVSPDPCARAYVWAPAKPAAETAVTLLDTGTTFSRFMQVPQPAAIGLDIPDPCDRRAGQVTTEPRTPRAPPAA